MLILTETEQTNMIMSSESSAVPGLTQALGPQCMTPVPCHEYPHSPPVPHHLQQPGAPCQPQSSHQHHQWDINDSALPLPDLHDSFEQWPSGHCRRVYRGDSDDARRHVSGWAMRNTNNHNALILKKSCLGVLVCSLDCQMESGRKVHLRPAICDKARRKQIGKPCPNPGCSGKLDLLSCRGHCGYPVTHFWRHLNNAVYFQAKGFHDHPRPEVKSLSEKGRHAFSKQLRQDGNRVISVPTKRRFPILTTDDISERKLFIPSKDEVMCSCPPFECVCPKSSPHTTLMPPPLGYMKDAFLPHRSPPNAVSSMEQLPPGAFTQINITNTCMPPPSLDVSIPGTGFEIYKNCAKFGHHGHFYDSNEMKMFRYGVGDSISNSLSHNQSANRSPIDDLRSAQILSCPNPGSLQSNSYHSRTFANVSPGNSLSSMGDAPDECNKYRTINSPYFSKNQASQKSVDDRSPMLSQPLKTEPDENGHLTSSAHPGDSGRNFQSDTIYHPILDFSADPVLSPRIVENHAKFERSSDDIGKTSQQQQEGCQEPTYITLTSPQRATESRQSQREYHACRLGHMTRSPSASDNFLYTPTSVQPTHVDNIGSPVPNSSEVIRHSDPRDMPSSQSSSSQPRRLSPTMPRLVLGENDSQNANTRSSGLYPPLPSHHETPVVPFSINNDFHMPSYPPVAAPYASGQNVPYGYYCNDMFPSTSQQAYRNRSINITLTYN